MHEDAIARRVVRPWPWLVSVVGQRVVEVISVFDWVANAVVWCLKAGHSRRVHIKDREHGRGLPEFVRQPTRTRMISQRRSRVRFGLLLIMVDPRPDCAGRRPGCASRWPLKRHQGMRRGHARCRPWSPQHSLPGWIVNCLADTSVIRPIGRPRRSVRFHALPSTIGVTMTSKPSSRFSATDRDV